MTQLYLARRTFLGIGGAAVAVMPLAGCGFRPVYGRFGPSGTPAVRDAMAAVRVLPIGDRSGQRLTQILNSKLQNGAGTPRYELDVKLRQDTQELGVRRDSTTSRANVFVTASLSLYENGTRVLAETAQSVVSYNILDDQYATVASQSDAIDRALLVLGDEISFKLATYFDRRVRQQSARR